MALKLVSKKRLSRLRKLAGLIALGVGALTGCAPAGDPSSVNTGPPSGLQYSSNPARYPYGVEITPNLLFAQGSKLQSATINTALPEGLEFDPMTGTISGTPESITPAQEFVITARNPHGANFMRLLLEITDLPPVMTYGGDTVLDLDVNVAAAAITPDLAGGAATSCESVPPLPAGMTLSDQCEISGTPLVAQAATVHLVSAVNSGGSSTIAFTITVNDLLPVISYADSPYTFHLGVEITDVAVVSTGGVIASCTIAPALPAGLTLSSACGISGTPEALAAATDYVITAINVNGANGTATINILVNNIAPAISFSGSPFTFTKETAIAAATPQNTGSPITSCAMAPAVPAGLSLSDTCVLSGTPTEASTATDYTVTATNPGGSGNATINITITDIPPKLVYFGTSFTFVAGQNVEIERIPAGGGTPATCVAVPALPAGLSIENATCKISGTPASGAAQKNYLITATNSGGSAQKTLSITVQEIPPAISYAGSPFTFQNNISLPPIPAANTGGVITNCSAEPGLPTGLSLSTSCSISGTPTGVLPAADYTITASNTAGSSTATINIAVTEQAPSISYAGSPFVYAKASAIATVMAANSGGPITSCTAAPALPAGLSVSNATCAISGTPSAITAAADYTITANNSIGSSNAVINITVNDLPPAISYPTSPFSFTKDTGIASTSAVNTGGAITSCNVNPALPSGLSIAADCTLSGTPNALSSAAPYTITANNTGGSSNAIISISVTDIPPVISFSPTVFVFTKDDAIPAITGTSTGGAIASCSSSPTLPAGLSINATTCEITGTPTSVSAAANFVITATNSGGSSAVTLNIAVNDDMPAFSYAGGPFVESKGTPIDPLVPTSTGGTIVSCSASPSLPGGLSLSNGCVISGTPGVISAPTVFTITATNSAGTASAAIDLQVNDVPPVISFAGSPFTHAVGTPIAPLSPSNTGGAITGCSSNPLLPAGLSLSAGCALSGTPSAPAPQTDYVITATNTGGNSDFTLRITVNDIAPDISFAGGPYSYPKTLAMTPLSPGNTGGAVVSCDVVPALPSGLTLAANCTISGTPTLITAATDYTVTATNTGGSSIKLINITISDAPPVLSYVGGPFTYTKDALITPLSAANAGGVVTSCISAPALPTGLSLSSTCEITGTPTSITAANVYTISGTNLGGTSSTPVTITIADIAPAIDYIPTSYNFNYTSNVAIDPLTPNSTAGPIASCTVSPALPAGLSINSGDCTISGTPVVARAATDYTVTATNSGGSSAVIITITVLDQAPAIAYTANPYTLYRTVATAPITPTNTGGASSSCSSSPVLPAGLSLSAACVVSGTPTVLSGATSYTITAGNPVGNSTATIWISVLEPAPSITYSGSPFSFQRTVAITPLTPINIGGTPATCTSAPVLPAGLSISALCEISGTPTNITPAADYTITATNTTGSSSQTINIATPDTPPSISYAGGPYSYLNGVAIAPLTAANTGGATTGCSSAPALPAGLSLSSTCEITGTPPAPVASTDYTITATNSGGSSDAIINITVVDSPPDLNYAPANFVYKIRETISNVNPINLGGAITGCSSAPALPAGLSLSSGCVISAAATVKAAAADYTITASNSGGNSSFVINIEVTDLPQILFYGYTALSGAFNGTAPLSQNIWKAASDGQGRVALTQNSNASLNSIYPTFSADGASVLYSSRRDLNGFTNGATSNSYNIWKSTPTGTAPTKLSTNSNASLDSEQPVFSPDGTKIAFVSKTALTGLPDGAATLSYNLWVMNADGTGKTPLTSNSNAGLDSYSPVFSPDGSVIYFYSKNDLTNIDNGTAPGSFNIWKANTDGSGRAALTSEVGVGRDSMTPAISPDGLTVTYSSKSRVGGIAALSYNIWTMTSAGVSRTRLTPNIDAGLDSTEPQFSPDGTEILFASKMAVNAAPASSFNIWKMAVNGTSQVALTTNNDANLDSESPRFSTDNLKIVFTSKMNIGATPAQSRNIWIMNSDGTSPTPITSNTNAGLDSFLAPGRVWYAD